MKELLSRFRVFLPLLFLLSACGSPPPATEALPNLPDPALLDRSDFTASDNLSNQARDLLRNSDYDGLEKLAAQAEASTDVMPGGSILPEAFYDGLIEIGHADEARYQQKMDALKAWMQARPDSPIPKVAMAKVLTNYAWFARGGGFADSVSQQAWKDFGDRLQEGREYLEQASDKRQNCSSWYCAMTVIALGQSWDHDAYFKMVNEEFARKPAFVELHGHVTNYLLPRWFGSNDELRDYITKAADRIGGDEGDMLYARLARKVFCYSHSTDDVADLQLSWPRLKHGMELICNRYPHSTEMANYFCLFACVAKDQPVAKFLFQHLGNKIDQDIWGDSLESSRAWAQAN